MNQYYTYILTNKYNNVFYTGVTNNLVKRIYEHKNKLQEGFTKKYNLTKLVYYEIHQDIKEAIIREKQIKNWHRNWKINLIIENNPELRDLYSEIIK